MNLTANPPARLVAVLFFAGFLATGCTSLHGKTEAEDTQAKAQIERRLQQVIDAAEKKEFDRLESYHLYGAKFTKFTGSSAARLDAAAGRKGEHDGLGAIEGLKMRAEDLKIDVFGKVGIATLILDYSFHSGSATIRRKERTTLVFVKEAGEWKITHEHLSTITP